MVLWITLAIDKHTQSKKITEKKEDGRRNNPKKNRHQLWTFSGSHCFSLLETKDQRGQERSFIDLFSWEIIWELIVPLTLCIFLKCYKNFHIKCKLTTHHFPGITFSEVRYYKWDIGEYLLKIFYNESTFKSGLVHYSDVFIVFTSAPTISGEHVVFEVNQANVWVHGILGNFSQLWLDFLICNEARSTSCFGLDMTYPPKRLLFWTSGAQHMRWLSYEVPAWFIDPIHWWVHSCTSYTEMGPTWGSRSLRHDFGGYISTQMLLLWVPLFPRHQEASNFFIQWRTDFPQPSDCDLKTWSPWTKCIFPPSTCSSQVFCQVM